MSERLDPLDAVAALERRYNGPVPEPLWRIARLGSPEMVALLEAEGQAAFFKSMLHGQLQTIRQRRAAGTLYPSLLADLALYRRQWKRWHRAACTLRASAAALSDATGRLVAASRR